MISICNVVSPDFREGCGSEQIRLGSHKTSQNSINMDEFLSGLRFEQRNKLDELRIKLYTTGLQNAGAFLEPRPAEAAWKPSRKPERYHPVPVDFPAHTQQPRLNPE